MGTPAIRSADTSAEADAIMIKKLRAMTPTQRAAVAAELCRATTALAIAGIKRQFGDDIPEEELRYQLLVRRYGKALADEVRSASS